MISELFLVSDFRKKEIRIRKKWHKISHNSMKKYGQHSNFNKLGRGPLKKHQTKFEANSCICLLREEVKKGILYTVI